MLHAMNIGRYRSLIGMHTYLPLHARHMGAYMRTCMWVRVRAHASTAYVHTAKTSLWSKLCGCVRDISKCQIQRKFTVSDSPPRREGYAHYRASTISQPRSSLYPRMSPYVFFPLFRPIQKSKEKNPLPFPLSHPPGPLPACRCNRIAINRRCGAVNLYPALPVCL